MNSFDPINISLSNLSYYISVDGEKLNIRAAKKPTWTIMKIVHWILYPNERISVIRDYFNAAVVNLAARPDCSIKQLKTLRTNVELVNGSLEKHNRGFIATRFGWNVVKRIDLSNIHKLELELTIEKQNECYGQILSNFKNLSKVLTENNFQFETSQESLLEFFPRDEDRVSHFRRLDLAFKKLKELGAKAKSYSADPDRELSEFMTTVRALKAKVATYDLDACELQVINDAIANFERMVEELYGNQINPLEEQNAFIQRATAVSTELFAQIGAVLAGENVTFDDIPEATIQKFKTHGNKALDLKKCIDTYEFCRSLLQFARKVKASDTTYEEEQTFSRLYQDCNCTGLLLLEGSREIQSFLFSTVYTRRSEIHEIWAVINPTINALEKDIGIDISPVDINNQGTHRAALRAQILTNLIMGLRNPVVFSFLTSFEFHRDPKSPAGFHVTRELLGANLPNLHGSDLPQDFTERLRMRVVAVKANLPSDVNTENNRILDILDKLYDLELIELQTVFAHWKQLQKQTNGMRIDKFFILREFENKIPRFFKRTVINELIALAWNLHAHLEVEKQSTMTNGVNNPQARASGEAQHQLLTGSIGAGERKLKAIEMSERIPAEKFFL